MPSSAKPSSRSVQVESPSAIDVPFAPRLVHRVRLGEGLLAGRARALVDLLFVHGGTGRVQIFIDDGLAAAQPRLAAQVETTLRAQRGVELAGATRIVPGGEEIKNGAGHIDALVTAMHEAKLCRRSCAIAIGGGAVLDAVGFAAAMAHRGVRLIRVPTTTLAQADSCVAVKCGVNRFGKKNYLGVFAAPWAVLIDPTLLATLGARDWRSGFSEAVKVGLVKDADLFKEIRRSARRIAERRMDAAWPVIRRSAEIHLRHITDGGDPFELNEARPLDFGHWAAHRLESMTGYRIRHGEAVAIGIALDAEYSCLMRCIDADSVKQIRETLRNLGFSLWDPAMDDAGTLLAGLEEFREHLGGQLTISMLRGIGRGFDVHQIHRTAMLDAVSRLRDQRGPDARGTRGSADEAAEAA